MSGKQTLRQRYLAAAAEIEDVYAHTSGQIGYDGRKRVREAYQVLAELGTHVPDIEPGWLPYGDMAEKDIAAAVRHAEQGLASAAVTLQLISQIRKLREELTALGGPYGVTEADIRSMIAEGFHTVLRKAADSMDAAIAWKAIRDMDGKQGGAVLDFTVGPVIVALREAERKARGRKGSPAA